MANQTYFLYAYSDRAVIANTGRGGGTSTYSFSKAKEWAFYEFTSHTEMLAVQLTK